MNWLLINKIRRFLHIGWIKTLYFNFTKLPLEQAIKLPIILTRNTYFYDLSGKIEIKGPVSSGMIRFGFFGEDTHVWNSVKTLLKIRGKIIFEGSSHYGIGVIIRVEENATLRIGNNVRISNNAKIISYKEIEIGSNCRIAWETQIIDTTFHYMKDVITDEVNVRDGIIKIGKNNWIGNRTTISKGTVTPDYCIIASGSLCNKIYEIPNNSFIAGIPAKFVKTNIVRLLDAEESEYINKLKNKKE